MKIPKFMFPDKPGSVLGKNIMQLRFFFEEQKNVPT